jgi:hypothetical protein
MQAKARIDLDHCDERCLEKSKETSHAGKGKDQENGIVSLVFGDNHTQDCTNGQCSE